MMTQSHLLITGFLAHRLRRARLDVRVSAFLVGSFLPDIPLGLLTIWYFVVPLGGRIENGEALFGQAYDRYFFEEPVWIVAHNTLHAPILLAVAILVGWRLAARGRAWGAGLAWFGAAAMLHTFIDALTHVHDGPLVFFPFEWSYRIAAPVSYWDPRYGGAVFSRFETALDAFIIAYLAVVWWRSRSAVESGEGSAPEGILKRP